MASYGNVIEVSEATFARDVIERSQHTLVVVDFWAAWCGPCRVLGPTLEKLAREPDSNFVLAKVDVDQNQSLSWQYRVQGIPAVKAFWHGEVVGEFVGAQPEPQVRRFLKEVMPSVADEEVTRGMAALAAQDYAKAVQLLRTALLKEPGNPTALLGLAKALLFQGQGCEARDILAGIGAGPEFAVAENLGPLATYLCDAESRWKEEDEITPLEAQYRHVAQLLTRGNFAAALDGLLDVLRVDRRYRKGQAKDVMLGLFSLLGEQHKLTQTYRQELAMVLW